MFDIFKLKSRLFKQLLYLRCYVIVKHFTSNLTTSERRKRQMTTLTFQGKMYAEDFTLEKIEEVARSAEEYEWLIATCGYSQMRFVCKLTLA